MAVGVDDARHHRRAGEVHHPGLASQVHLRLRPDRRDPGALHHDGPRFDGVPSGPVDHRDAGESRALGHPRSLLRFR